MTANNRELVTYNGGSVETYNVYNIPSKHKHLHYFRTLNVQLE